MKIESKPVTEKQKQFYQDFLEGGVPRYIFGTNEYAASIGEVIAVDGYIDDFTKDLIFKGKPVLRLDDIPDNAMVVSAVTSIRPVTAQRCLNGWGGKEMDYFSFSRVSGLPLKEVEFWEGAADHYHDHEKQYIDLYSKLSDNLSKDTFQRLVQFRVHNDFEVMKVFEVRLDSMYLEPFLDFQTETPVFVDAGAFDGKNSCQFMEKYPKFKRVFMFEPVSKAAQKLSTEFEFNTRIKVINAGLYDTTGTAFISDNGSSSTLSKDGGEKIDLITLDSLELDGIDFIKMDIEGAEMAALHGAAESIRKFKPNLAISVYHNVEQLISVPSFIEKISPNYKFFLRHYTEGWSETVLFAVPA